jgi:hypothetical protein
MHKHMRRRLSPEGLDMRDGTPENYVFRVTCSCGITSPGAAFCAAPLHDTRRESVRQVLRESGEFEGCSLSPRVRMPG